MADTKSGLVRAPRSPPAQVDDAGASRSPLRVALGLLSFLSVRFSGALMGTAVIVLMTRSLSTQAFGTFALALTLTQLATTFSDAGVNSLLTRETVARPEIERSLTLWAVAARALVGALFGLGCWFYSLTAVSGGTDRAAVTLVLATLPLVSFALLLNSLSRHLALGVLALLTLLQSSLWLAAVAVLSARHAGLLAFAAAYLATTVAFGLVTVVVVPRVLPSLRRPRVGDAGQRRLGRAEALALLRLAVPLGTSAALVALYAKIDNIVLYAFVGAGRSAPYALAFRVLDQLSVLPGTLSTFFFPHLNQQMVAGGDVRAVVERYVRVMLVVAVPCTLVVIADAPRIVARIFGPSYAGSSVLLQLLAPSFLMICLGWVVTALAVATRRPRVQLVTAVGALFFNVLLNVLLIPSYGAKAAALVTLGTEVLVVALMGWGVRDQLRGALPSFSVLLRLDLLGGLAVLLVRALPFVPGLLVGAVVVPACAVLLRLVTLQDVNVRT